MNKSEFSKIRHRLGKTQSQLGRLLGTSFKAIQSFEQGWRNVSAHTERQLLLLLALKSASGKKSDPCWVIRKCPPKIKQDCPAWEFRAGHLCWFINGTMLYLGRTASGVSAPPASSPRLPATGK